jgi:predicted GNAT superfamily acetyltransferase
MANGQEIGAGLLFPRTLNHGYVHVYTLRYHAFAGKPLPAQPMLLAAFEEALYGARLVWYDPAAPHHYTPNRPGDTQSYGLVEIGRPSAQEAQRIPALQQQIWGSLPEELYPVDIHSAEFASSTSLLARVDGQVAGFLFGFYKFGGSPLPVDWCERFNGDLRLESQIMGVLPAYRGLHISSLLKRRQAEIALDEGIQVINWTADPLQYTNASLNLGRLRAIAFDFFSNLYPFRNQLNRVPASRLGLTWLSATQRVQERWRGESRSTVIDLRHLPGIARANVGWQQLTFDLAAPLLAIEIPANWTQLQHDDLGNALHWRAATDRLFAHYIGREPGQYCLTDVGIEGERCYLIGERVDDALWRRLAKIGQNE